MNEIKVNPDSYFTSQISPIILSESKHVNISFYGCQVDNIKDPKKNIKGKLVIKKKTKDINSFDMIEKFSKKDISFNQYVEIALDTSETYELAKGLCDYYRLLSGKKTNPYESTIYIEKDEELEKIKCLLQNKEGLLDLISKVDTSALNMAVNINNLQKIKHQIEDNMDNDQ